MAIDNTVDNLVTSLKTQTLFPTSQATYSTDDLISFLNIGLQSYVVPLIDSVQEEYFVVNYDIAFDPTNNVYDIPARAIGGKLRDITFVDTTGREYSIPRIKVEDIKSISDTFAYAPINYGFYLRDNQVVLFYGITATAINFPILRMKYIRRPNELKSKIYCGKVVNVNPLTKDVTLDNGDTTWTTSTTFDVIKGTPTFSSKGDDCTISQINGFVLTFNTLPTGIAVGDYVCESGFSCIPQIPKEGFFLLMQSAIISVLEGIGNEAQLGTAYKKLEIMENKFLKIITPRVEGSVIKLSSNNTIFDY